MIVRIDRFEGRVYIIVARKVGHHVRFTQYRASDPHTHPLYCRLRPVLSAFEIRELFFHVFHTRFESAVVYGTGTG